MMRSTRPDESFGYLGQPERWRIAMPSVPRRFDEPLGGARPS